MQGRQILPVESRGLDQTVGPDILEHHAVTDLERAGKTVVTEAIAAEAGGADQKRPVGTLGPLIEQLGRFLLFEDLRQMVDRGVEHGDHPAVALEGVEHAGHQIARLLHHRTAGFEIELRAPLYLNPVDGRQQGFRIACGLKQIAAPEIHLFGFAQPGREMLFEMLDTLPQRRERAGAEMGMQMHAFQTTGRQPPPRHCATTWVRGVPSLEWRRQGS
jgi:hypothetical protein